MSYHTSILAAFLFVCGLTAAASSQQFMLSVAGRQYQMAEEIWVSLSVTGSSALPGAFAAKLRFDTTGLSFGQMLSSPGLFVVTPSASCRGDTVSIAGFQGISDSDSFRTIILATFMFKAKGTIIVDTSTFSIAQRAVYSTTASLLQLRDGKEISAVRMTSRADRALPRVTLVRGYLRFAVPAEGPVSVRIVNAAGRIIAAPMARAHLGKGTYAVPLGTLPKTGFLIAVVEGRGFSYSQKLGVAR
jgi:hypothetical protein